MALTLIMDASFQRIKTETNFSGTALTYLRHHMLKQKQNLPVPVNQTTHKMLFSFTHGFLQGLVISGVNPIDKLHLLATNCNSNKSYETFVKNPWKGSAYAFKTSTPRNMIVYFVLPAGREKLEKYGISELKSKLYIGLGAGVVDSILMARYEAKKQLIRMEDEVQKDKIWHFMSAEKRRAATFAAIKWGIPKAAFYWSAFIPLRDAIEKNTQSYKDNKKLTTAESAFAGALGGGLATMISYPYVLFQIRAILNPHYSFKQDLKPYFQQHGFFSMVREKAYKNLSIALPRQMFVSALFNCTSKATEKFLEEVVVKKKI